MTQDPGQSAPKLVRQLSLVDATMIVMGSMIGSGIFITSAETTRFVGSPGWLLVAWALAGLLTITGSACCAELAAMMPHAGGQYVFLREAYGRPVGFLFGWALFLVVQTGTIAAVCVAFAKFLGVLVPWVAAENYIVAPVSFGRFALSLSTQQLVAVAIILALTITNTRGLKTGTLIQNTLTFTKTAALIGLILLGFIFGVRPSAAAWSSDWWNPWQNAWSPPADAASGLNAVASLAFLMLLGRAMVGPLFSQTAWSNVTFTGGEVRDPGRTLPRALILGCSIVVGLYLLANVAYVCTLSLREIETAREGRVATVLMEKILGPPGATVMAAAILISTFGCANGLVLAGARVYYAMARDGLFFSGVGTTNARHVPAVALLAQGAWTALLTLPRTVSTNAAGAVVYGNVYNQLLEYIVSADLAFYTLMVLAVIVMRFKARAADRPYRTWAYPLPPLIYIALAVLLMADLVYMAPETSGIGFALVLTGIPVYLLWRRTPAARAGAQKAGQAPRTPENP
ncbi:MAG TPA: amino acid permease [Isosphaeraceae bacterium]|jgi:APA family basic amino acid/polyamine antiporter|nr:amino acid permease [Isosphaeraceae bacterium]